MFVMSRGSERVQNLAKIHNHLVSHWSQSQIKEERSYQSNKRIARATTMLDIHIYDSPPPNIHPWMNTTKRQVIRNEQRYIFHKVN